MAQSPFNVMKPIRCILILALAAALTGCAGVLSKQPVGQPLPASSKLDVSGVWALYSNGQNPADQPHIFVKQLPGGVLQMATVQWTQGKFQLKQLSGVITQDNDAYYVNFTDTNQNTSQPRYAFARLIVTNDNHLLLVPTNASYFESAVKAGKIAGHVETKNSATNVYLDSNRDVLDALIQPDLIGRQFELDHALVLKRVGRIDTPH